MITATQLINIASLDPRKFYPFVDLDASDSEQERQLCAHLNQVVIPGALSEVDVPLMEATEGHSLPLPDAVIQRRYPKLASLEREAINAKALRLRDLAVQSYARSEINKQIASDDEVYDKNSDQDRIQGNQRLEKLISLVADITSGANAAVPVLVSPEMTRPGTSRTVRRSRVW